MTQQIETKYRKCGLIRVISNKKRKVNEFKRKGKPKDDSMIHTLVHYYRIMIQKF